MSATPAPAVWSDTDPLMKAVAAAVWEHCHTDGSSTVSDDPRTIAAVTVTAVLAAPFGPPASGLRDRVAGAIYERLCEGSLWADAHSDDRQAYRDDANVVLAVLPAFADRVAMLRAAAEIVRALPTDTPAERLVLDRAARHLRRVALDIAEQEARPKPPQSARQSIINYLTGRAVCTTPRPPAEAEALLDAYQERVFLEATNFQAANLRHKAGEATQPKLDTCGGCAHALHPRNHCPVVAYGDKCVCDEGPAIPPAPAGRAAVLLELEARYRGYARDAVHPDFGAAYAAVANDLHRLADEAQQPKACGPVPDACDAEGSEPCANHERQQAHAEGQHAFCGRECEARCTCADAGDAFVPAGHYTDCPQAEGAQR